MEVQIFGELRRDVPLKDISVPSNSRMEVNEGHLDELMMSMKHSGLLEPIGLVRKGSKFQVAYGHRRLKAALKIGWKEISAVIRDEDNEFDTQIMNIAENLQRREVNLDELGNYIQDILDQGLNMKELAARTGIPKVRLARALKSWRAVPAEHRRNVRVNVRARDTGGIPISTARAIESARKTLHFKSDVKDKLFKLAKTHGPAFQAKKVRDYAENLEDGRTWNEEVSTVINWYNVFNIEKREQDRIVKKYVTTGRYKNFRAVVIGILRGEIREKLKIEES